MYQIDSKIFSHLDLLEADDERSTPKKVAQSEGLVVHTFRDLLENMAKISYNNPKVDLLFRGQDRDYMTKRYRMSEALSSIYLSIYRYKPAQFSLSEHERRQRFDALDRLSDRLVEKYKFDGATNLRSFLEIPWAILQHYEKTPTPLVDLTESLIVAASFATRKGDEGYGYVYAFGFPRLHSSISYHVDDRMVVVRLASACPPDALRAHFQQAYFAGSFPHTELRSSAKNLAQRMIAKFKVHVKGFWSDGFRPLPSKVLFPEEDKVAKLLAGL